MSLLDLFTGAASKRAANQNAAAIAQGQAQANNALTSNTNQAIGLLGTSNNWLGGTASSALNVGYKQARDDVTAGYDAAQPALARLGEQYAPMVAGGQRAFDGYLDATGANGVEGSARATDAFRSSPGYEFARDQGLEAIQRTAAARGGLGGGNTSVDLLKYATGFADQTYRSHLDDLYRGAGFYQTGLAGQGQGLTAQAGAAVGRGTALGNLGTGLGTGQASIYDRGASTYSGLGRDTANVFNNATNQTISNNNARAQADNAAGANILGAVFGGLNMLSGGAGSAAGRGSGSPNANVSPYANSNPFVRTLGNIFG